jgi:hypothetical protein
MSAKTLVEGATMIAEASGYSVEQKVTVRDANGYQMPSLEPADRPWFVRGIAGKTPFTYGTDLWFGPFATEEQAATEGLPKILSCDARAQDLGEGYSVRVAKGDGPNRWLIYRDGECKSDQPLSSLSAALDEAERLASEHREGRERLRLNQQMQRIARCRIPEALTGIRLENFSADTATLADALQVAHGYVNAFTPASQNLWFCGDAESGKTSLACAIASAVAAAGYFARYASIAEVIHAQGDGAVMNELLSCDLLVLDWSGIQAAGYDKASRDQSELLGALSGFAAGAVLDARFLNNKPTLLVADCDRWKLQQCLSVERYSRLLRRQIVDFVSGGSKCPSA